MRIGKKKLAIFKRMRNVQQALLRRPISDHSPLSFGKGSRSSWIWCGNSQIILSGHFAKKIELFSLLWWKIMLVFALEMDDIENIVWRLEIEHCWPFLWRGLSFAVSLVWQLTDHSFRTICKKKKSFFHCCCTNRCSWLLWGWTVLKTLFGDYKLSTADHSFDKGSLSSWTWLRN